MTPDPIAVVGLGCRFAGGVDSADDLWRLLLAGETTAGPVPPDRWRAYAEQSREQAAALDRVVARGSFRDDVTGFDAAFFGISAREAEQLDPQQRTALEVAWEALEDAGVAPTSLAGTDTAVFLGVGTDDYGRRLLEDLPGITPWTGIGASPCGVPNRVSHALDLRGPSVAVDTACSSSLVAVHSACAALRAGETRLALAGGVMLMTGPGLTAVLTEAGAVGTDGRSKPFDEAADGYGRGEGCGVVVLKRLADARADGDDVLAVIRGSAVRQDGRTEGIMAPSGDAQADLMRAAYAAAGVDPATVGYVEAHGTGTPAGDPVEAGALCRVLARPADRPVCRVGSVKATIGHTEAAAGVAGMIKAVLALRHRWVPATPQVTRPRSDVPWRASGLEPVVRGVDWPDPGHPRRAGVASYGYGGTIAHLVLEEGDPLAAPAAAELDAPAHFALSAASPAALRAQAGRLADAVEANPLPHTAFTLATARAHLRHRAVITAADTDALRAGLTAIAEGTSADAVVTGSARDGGAVWVFSGHGAQWAGMGRGLLDVDPDFTEVIDRLGPVYQAELGTTPREVITADDLGGVDRVQAALCAVQLGLAASWRARGLRPAAVIGHSVGEIAAAVTAGSLTEAQGARLVCRRSALLPRAQGRGAMFLVDLGFDECAEAVADFAGVTAAISASPHSTVAAGDADAVALAAAALTAAGRTVRRVDSDVAFHTDHMRDLARELAVAVADLTPARPGTTLYTTALADPRGGHPQDAAYWAANLRDPVRFAQAVQAAVADGHRTFLEVSAHPVVAHSITETLAAEGVTDGAVVPSLRRDRPEAAMLSSAAAALHCRGVRVDLDIPAGRRVRLPGVAWQHSRFWVERPSPTRPGPPNTLLGAGTDVHGVAAGVWTTTLHTRTRPYPGSHPVLGTEIVPAAVTLLTYLAAGGATGLSDVELHRPVVVPGEDDPARELQVVREGTALRIASRLPGGDWAVHSSARALDAEPRRVLDRDADEPVDAAGVVDRLAELGVAAMGFPWRVDKLTRGEGLLVAEVDADPEGVLRHRGWASLLDAALSTASVVFDGPPALRMPASLDTLAVAGTAPDRAVVVAALDRGRPFTVDVEVLGEDGVPLARLTGLRYAEPEGAAESRPELGETVFDIRPTPVDDPADAVRRVAVADPGLAAALRAAGAEIAVDAAHVLVPTSQDPAESTLALIRAVRDARPGQRVWAVGGGHITAVGRVLATEHPDTFGGVLDLRTPDAAPRLLRHLTRPGAEPVLTLDTGGATAPRAVPLGRSSGAAPACRPDGTYLVTGGLGAVGLAVAAHLAERGARRLVLLGRTPLPPRGAAEDDPVVRAVRAIEGAGATVFAVAADVTDPAAVRAALADLPVPPVRGVVHAAGQVRSAPAVELSEDDLRVVLHAKVEGAKVVDELFPELDFLVLFSSVGPLLGLPGQAAYAAANGFLDALAAQRRARGDTGCVSIAWTSWRGLGMATSAAATDVELDARGSADLTPERSLAALDRVLAARHDLGGGPVAVLPVRTDHPGPRPPLLAALEIDPPAEDGDAPSWTGLTGADLTAELTARATACAAAVLGVDPDSLDADAALGEQGVDSLLGAVLRVRLERLTGVALAPTLLWNHPTTAAIGAHLASRVAPPEGHDT
ncbi:type I polyketide synthase [Actinokineospora spheciospongiae]|uniref:type I polyketide synthase n=1 Tax=Actinokineospora spheciospongiae TaxID=909613 RepID=UPI000D70FD46|nr:type I polyketide synthase [Actinokineospora spheciospongiae]PWW63608.1 6-methylsalicylic acid synthase [Actinokineospora spheciospongiae]